MAKKLYPETDIQAIADAIRGKNGSSDTYTVGQMASAIQAIPSGGGEVDVKQTLYFKPGETDHGAGDYIAVSTDGETWTEYYYSDLYNGVVVPGSFIKLLYSSPYFIFEAVDSERQGNSIILTDNVSDAQLLRYHWQHLATGKIEDANANDSGPIPPMNGNVTIFMSTAVTAESAT